MLFTNKSPFVVNDLRKDRWPIKITADMLNKRFAVLLPVPSLKGKTVLDLGCCIGALGHWALSYGAAHYTGVELQREFASQAQQLLYDEGHLDYDIANMGIESFLERWPEGEHKYDIVVLAGILPGFIDPIPVLRKAAALAREAVVIDAQMPPAMQKGMAMPNLSIMELQSKQGMNSATVAGSVTSYGSCMSPAFIFNLMQAYGFEQEWTGKPQPSIDDRHAYTGDAVPPVRFLARYRRKGEVKATLAERLADHDDTAVEPWVDSPPPHVVLQNAIPKPWVFDATVANEFESHAVKHIPNYYHVIRKTANLIMRSQGLGARVLDVGCATGVTLRYLESVGFLKENLWGVDCSQPMLDAAPDINYVLSETFPVALGMFSAIVANWTLHFMSPGARTLYLADAVAHLESGGVLIVSDRMAGDDITDNLRLDVKRSKGVTEAELVAKRAAIVGVLRPLPMRWYTTQFDAMGLQYEIVDADYQFVTFYCRKP